jgi:hypothetical protein
MKSWEWEPHAAGHEQDGAGLDRKDFSCGAKIWITEKE